MQFRQPLRKGMRCARFDGKCRTRAPYNDEENVLIAELDERVADYTPDVLFAKITDEQVVEWKARFGGAAES